MSNPCQPRPPAAWEPVLQAAGLESPEGLVLSALWEADGATTADIARRVRTSDNAVRRLIESLDLLGYVEREAEPEGVWLTQDGFRLRERAATSRPAARHRGRRRRSSRP